MFARRRHAAGAAKTTPAKLATSTERERLGELIATARSRLEDLAKGKSDYDKRKWFADNGDIDGAGMLIKMAQYSLDSSGKVATAKAVEHFSTGGQVMIDGLITSSVNASVVCALLLAIQVPLVTVEFVYPLTSPSHPLSSTDGAATIFDDFALWMSPGDPMMLRRAFHVVEVVALSFSILFSAMSLVCSMVLCQGMVVLPGPIAVTRNLLGNMNLFLIGPGSYPMTVVYLLFALAFAVARVSAFGFVMFSIVFLSYITWFGYHMVAKKGFGTTMYDQLRDEAGFALEAAKCADRADRAAADEP